MKFHQILHEPNEVRNFSKIILVKKNQNIEIETLMEFIAQNTTGNTLIKAVVMPGGNLSLKGNIRIGKNASGAQAFLRHQILLVGDNSQAISVPELEIENNDVIASHASAIGPIDQSQLFYLMSRGFSYQSAIKLIIKSFLAV